MWGAPYTNNGCSRVLLAGVSLSCTCQRKSVTVHLTIQQTYRHTFAHKHSIMSASASTGSTRAACRCHQTPRGHVTRANINILPRVNQPLIIVLYRNLQQHYAHECAAVARALARRRCVCNPQRVAARRSHEHAWNYIRVASVGWVRLASI